MIKEKPVYGDNAFCFIAYVSRKMKKAGCTQEAINKYIEVAQSGDYDNLVEVSEQQLESLEESEEDVV